MRSRQAGAVAILLLTVLILGIAWFAVGALGKAPVGTVERENATSEALQAGKQALLAYVAQYAARPGTAEPGQLPCPEDLDLLNPGVAGSGCAGVAVGRLPWRTLGIDPPRDGNGEPLWYMMRGFRSPPINFATPGQLTHNGATVVALVLAPGHPLNTSTDPGAPPAGCNKLNQQVAARNAAPLNPNNFLECGVAAGSLTTPGDPRWTNDRAVAITAAEWADAIAGPVADRLQRQVAPAMETFRGTTSLTGWGQRFLPNASTIDAALVGSQPETNNLCGNNGMRAGMPPTATVASGVCDTNWSSWSSWGVDLGVSLNFGGCAAQPAYLRCTYVVLLGGVAPSPWIVATAPRIGHSFRRFDPATIQVIRNGATVVNAVRNYSASVSSADGSATIQFEIQFPLLALVDTLEVRIPYADDALLADARSAWWIDNGWDRFTYYGVSQAATHDPGTTVCNPGGVTTNCLTVNNMSAPTNDKRLVLVLMGRALPGTTQPSYTLSNYWERQNASFGVIYEVGAVDATFNDRVAACPFTYTPTSGPVPAC